MRPDLRAVAGRPVIIGAGVAGLMVALRLAPEPVVILSKGPLGTGSSSAFAQGGLAASLGDDDDPVLHLADTLAAGDGLCDDAIAKRITRAAPSAIHDLVRLELIERQRPKPKPGRATDAQVLEDAWRLIGY